MALSHGQISLVRIIEVDVEPFTFPFAQRGCVISKACDDRTSIYPRGVIVINLNLQVEVLEKTWRCENIVTVCRLYDENCVWLLCVFILHGVLP